MAQSTIIKVLNQFDYPAGFLNVSVPDSCAGCENMEF